jgi:hypothetical protein
MTTGSVCRHLKIVGRVATVLSAYQPAALRVATLPLRLSRMVRKLDLLEFALEFVTEGRKARDNELT